MRSHSIFGSRTGLLSVRSFIGVRVMLKIVVFVVNVEAVFIVASLRFKLIIFNFRLVPEEAKLVDGVIFDLLLVDKSGLDVDLRPIVNLCRN